MSTPAIRVAFYDDTLLLIDPFSAGDCEDPLNPQLADQDGSVAQAASACIAQGRRGGSRTVSGWTILPCELATTGQRAVALIGLDPELDLSGTGKPAHFLRNLAATAQALVSVGQRHEDSLTALALNTRRRVAALCRLFATTVKHGFAPLNLERIVHVATDCDDGFVFDGEEQFVSAANAPHLALIFSEWENDLDRDWAFDRDRPHTEIRWETTDNGWTIIEWIDRRTAADPVIANGIVQLAVNQLRCEVWGDAGPEGSTRCLRVPELDAEP